ncbi:uncharacterized protein LOC106011293 [Aplysia californica]|uniref:Uncharacterized protein LOC106011293 n=1 Tax=Aplysia californica TaxID=6500 RepID=A0ABM0ZWC6_APLCA|nr:uncharacterized protein LOC106011293 [Aplysia californica]
MTTLYQVIVLICTQVMVIGLKRSSEFRKGKETVDKATGNCKSAQVPQRRTDSQSRENGETFESRTQDHPAEDYPKFNREHQTADHPMKDHKTNRQNRIQIKTHEMTDTQTKDSSLTLQNRRVIKTVSALAIIFLVCNATRMAGVYTYILSNPDLNVFKRCNNVMDLVKIFIFLFQVINSSANTLVYYHFNPGFRKIFRSVFCRCGKSG